MKKLPIVILLIILFSLCCASSLSYAVEATVVYLVNPTSLCIWEEDADSTFLYVADIVQDTADSEQSVIHVFDAETSEWQNSIDVDGIINRIDVYNDVLYVIQDSKYLTKDLTDDNSTFVTVSQAVLDVACLDGNLYELRTSGLYRENYQLRSEAYTQVIVYDNKMYALGNNDIDIYSYVTNVGLTISGNLSDVGYGKMFPLSDKIALYAEEIVVSPETIVTIQGEDISFHPIFRDTGYGEYIEACADSADNLYVITDSNEVHKAQKSEVDSTYSWVDDWSIGSDIYSGTVPDAEDFTTYSLCYATNYPATIVYRTTDGATSVDSTITLSATDSFLVLGYAGEDNSYYYALIDGEFGWIKRSGSSLANDNCITVVATAVTNSDSVVTALLNHTTDLYTLPIVSNSYRVTNAYEMNEELTLLQKIGSWYYVRFENGNCYFLLTSSVKNVKVENNSASLVIKRQKISTSTGSVSAYADYNLTVEANDTDGNAITLSNGTIVKVIREYANCCYVQLTDNVTYCYVSNDYLIDVDSITRSVLIGLILLFVGIALAIVVIVIVLRYRKNAKYIPPEV